MNGSFERKHGSKSSTYSLTFTSQQRKNLKPLTGFSAVFLGGCSWCSYGIMWCLRITNDKRSAFPDENNLAQQHRIIIISELSFSRILKLRTVIYESVLASKFTKIAGYTHFFGCQMTQH